MLADGAWEHLDVDVEGEGGLSVVGGGADARDAVVFGLVVGGDGEALVEELGVGGHDGGRLGVEVKVAWLWKIARVERCGVVF